MNCIDSLNEVVFFIRTGGYSDAASAFNRSIQHLEAFLCALSLTADLKNKMMYSLETVMYFYQKKDYIAVADIVEFELIPLCNKARQ